MVLAYRHAGAALLAPFSYIQLLWAVGFGYLFFGSLPDQMTLVGASVIVAGKCPPIPSCERVRARLVQPA